MILGEAFVHVRPDETGFGEELAAKMQGVFGNSGLIFGALAVAGTAAALDIGSHFEDAFHTIEQRTGTTGAALQGLEQNFKDVFASTPGATFKNVADALSEVEIRTGLTGDALETMTRKEVELGKITKSDVGATVEATTALMNKMGVAAKDQSSSLDILFKASQNSGKSIGDLTSDMTRAVPALSGFGLSFAQQAALVSSLEKAGVRTQAVVMGLGKEFAAAAKSGKDPIAVIGDLVNQIKNASSPTEQFSIAVAALGNRAGGDFVAAVNSGAFSIDELAKSLTSGADGIDATAESTMSLGDKFGLLKNKVLVALEPISMKMLDLANVIVDNIAPAFAGLSDFVSSTFGPTFTAISHDIADFIDGFRLGHSEVDGWGRSMATFGANTAEWVARVRDTAADMWARISPAFASFGAFLHDNLEPILIAVGGYIVYLAGASVVGALTAALTFLVGAVSGPVLVIAALAAGIAYAYQNIDGFRNAVNTTGEVLASTFQVVWSVLGPVFANLGASLADLANYFIDRWDKIRGAVETAITLIKVAVVVVFGPLVMLWRNFHEQIMAVVTLVWNQVVLTVQTAVRIIGDVFDFIISILSGKWGDAWNDVKDIFGAAFDFLVGSLGDLGGFIIDFFSSLPGNILSALGDLASLLLPKAIDLIGGFFSGLMAAWPQILEFFALIPFRILGLLIAANVWLTETGLHILEGLWGGLQSYWPTVMQFFIDLPGRVIGFLADAPGWLVSTGVAVLRGLWNGILSMLVWFGGQIASVPGWITSAIGDLGGLLHDAAVNLIVGLWNGIWSMKDWLMGKLGDLVGSIKDAITNPLGIFSPSTVFMGYGVNIGEGLALGLESTAQRVAEAQRRAFAAIGSADLPNLAGAFQTPGVDLGGVGGGSTGAAISQLATAVTQLAATGGGAGQPQALFHVENLTVGEKSAVSDLEFMMATKSSGI